MQRYDVASVVRTGHTPYTRVTRIFVGQLRALSSLRPLAIMFSLGLMVMSTVCTSTPAGAVPTPPNTVLALSLFAEGFQIYHSAAGPTMGTFVWQFFGPQATLYIDDTKTTQVGLHFNGLTAPTTNTPCPNGAFTGPTWQSDADCSTVTGMLVDSSPSPNPNSILELLLKAAANGGTGIFSDVAFIQRLDTVGGLAPAAPPAGLGEIFNASYTSDYNFLVAIPEPGSWLLLSTGLVGLIGYGWRWRRGV